MSNLRSMPSHSPLRQSALRAAHIATVLGLGLVTTSAAFAGSPAGLYGGTVSYRSGAPAGLYPVRPPAGLYGHQSGLYNGGQPGPTTCGLSRCLYGGSPAGLFNSRRPW